MKAARPATRADGPLLRAWAEHLATRPAHTRNAYLRDARALQELAGDRALTALKTADVRRFLAMLHARGLAGSSLARMLSAWRALYRFAVEHEASLDGNPCAGLRAP